MLCGWTTYGVLLIYQVWKNSEGGRDFFGIFDLELPYFNCCVWGISRQASSIGQERCFLVACSSSITLGSWLTLPSHMRMSVVKVDQSYEVMELALGLGLQRIPNCLNSLLSWCGVWENWGRWHQGRLRRAWSITCQNVCAANGKFEEAKEGGVRNLRNIHWYLVIVGPCVLTLH